MLLRKGGVEMNKAQVKNIIDGMPDGMEVDDYLVELVNRALFAERHAITEQVLTYTEGWDRIHRETALDVVEIIKDRERPPTRERLAVSRWLR